MRTIVMAIISLLLCSAIGCESVNSNEIGITEDCYLQELCSVKDWRSASAQEQDLMIKGVADQLAPDFTWVETTNFTCSGESNSIAVFRHERTGLRLNLIPGGKKIDNAEAKILPFLIGQLEVRQSCWDKIATREEHMKSGAFQRRELRYYVGENLPISGQSWYEVKLWLNYAGGDLRLPSEAEWVHSCCIPVGEKYYWKGDVVDSSHCWFQKNHKINAAMLTSRKGYGFTTDLSDVRPVTIHFDQMKWNAFGVVDLFGNVDELCSDSHDQEGYAIAKGGFQCSPPEFLTPDFRYPVAKDAAEYMTGFRVARAVDLSELSLFLKRSGSRAPGAIKKPLKTVRKDA